LGEGTKSEGCWREGLEDMGLPMQMKRRGGERGGRNIEKNNQLEKRGLKLGGTLSVQSEEEIHTEERGTNLNLKSVVNVCGVGGYPRTNC